MNLFNRKRKYPFVVEFPHGAFRIKLEITNRAANQDGNLLALPGKLLSIVFEYMEEPVVYVLQEKYPWIIPEQTWKLLWKKTFEEQMELNDAYWTKEASVQEICLLKDMEMKLYYLLCRNEIDLACTIQPIAYWNAKLLKRCLIRCFMKGELENFQCLILLFFDQPTSLAKRTAFQKELQKELVKENWKILAMKSKLSDTLICRFLEILREQVAFTSQEKRVFYFHRLRVNG